MGGSLGHLCSILLQQNPPSDSTTMAGPSTSKRGGGPDPVTPNHDLEQISESLWEFYSPPGVIDADILFFHGLSEGDSKEAYWTTWLSRDETVIWPKEWLKRECPNARILSVSYNSSARERPRESHLGMYTLGENLVNDIIESAEVECGQDRPVILVGHCLGGIVIKQFILSAMKMRDLKSSERIKNFLNNFKGVFFFATPHQGSREIENWARNLKDPSPMLDLLKILSTDTQRINEEFRQHRTNIKARSCAVMEARETHALGFNAVVVEEASARHDIDEFYTFEGADHFSVCRARQAKDFVVIRKLAQFTKEILEAESERRFKALNRPLNRPLRSLNGSKAMAIP